MIDDLTEAEFLDFTSERRGIIVNLARHLVARDHPERKAHQGIQLMFVARKQPMIKSYPVLLEVI